MPFEKKNIYIKHKVERLLFEGKEAVKPYLLVPVLSMDDK